MDEICPFLSIAEGKRAVCVREKCMLYDRASLACAFTVIALAMPYK